MCVKYNHTKFEQETQRWQPGTGVAYSAPWFISKSVKHRPKNAGFWVPCVEGAICIGTNLDDEQAPLFTA